MKSSIRGKLLLIWGCGIFLILLSSGAGFLMLWNNIRIYQDKVITSHVKSEAILQIQSNFKKQVQEWKDVLLRGSDPAALEKYWTGFQKMESTVQEQTKVLLSSISDPSAHELLDKLCQTCLWELHNL